MRYCLLLVPALIIACSDTAGSTPAGGSSGALLPDGGIAASPDAGAEALATAGKELRVPVVDGKAYVKLATPAVSTDADWDLAFDGLNITTNSGASAMAAGAGGAFGPLDAINFLSDTTPEIPFLTVDTTGGAFVDWYAYDGTTHALWSRFHHFGIKDGNRLFKVQIESYYGQRDGAAVTALFNLRYAEVTGGTVGPTIEVANLDGTAGGLASPATATSECIDFATNARIFLTPADAATSSAWQLCVRRSNITVNGGVSGPRGVTAVDIDAGTSVSLATVQAYTAESQRPAFDAINAASFDGKTFRADRVVSAFGDYWLDNAGAVPAPTGDAWLVLDAAGKQKYLVGFPAFEGATTTSAGTIVMRIKPVSD